MFLYSITVREAITDTVRVLSVFTKFSSCRCRNILFFLFLRAPSESIVQCV